MAEGMLCTNRRERDLIPRRPGGPARRRGCGGPGPPSAGAVRGAEEAGQAEQLAQYGGPAGAEGVLGDEAVLGADGGRVRRVRLGRAREHRQVGVAERLAVGVAGGWVVGDGEPHQAGDLGGAHRADAELGQGAFGEGRAALLVLGAVGAVDGVVEPGGQLDGGGVGGVRGEFVEACEYVGQVRGGVVAALGFRPGGEEAVGVRVGVAVGGCAGRGGGRVPAGAERGGVGRGVGRGVHAHIVRVA